MLVLCVRMEFLVCGFAFVSFRTRLFVYYYKQLFSMNNFGTTKRVPGKNLLPGVGKFFLTSKLDHPSPAIYGNIVRGFSLLRHHATKDIISLTAWLLGAPVCTVSIQAI